MGNLEYLLVRPPQTERSGTKIRTFGLKKIRTSCLKKSGPCLKKSGPGLKKSGPGLKKSGPCLKKSGPRLKKSGLFWFKIIRTFFV